MVKVRHFMDAVEKDDGLRIWVEPIGLTRDLQAWCSVEQLLPMLGPPRELSEWLAEHPDGYEYFRGRYHEWLSRCIYRPVLQQLAQKARKGCITLLHASDDPEHNCAMALMELVSEFQAYKPVDD